VAAAAAPTRTAHALCGSELWPLKTLSDPQRKLVNLVRTDGRAQSGRGHGGGGDDEEPTRHGLSLSGSSTAAKAELEPRRRPVRAPDPHSGMHTISFCSARGVSLRPSVI